MTFTLTLLSVAVLAGVFYLRGARTKGKIEGASWDDLIGRLEPVPAEGLTRIALDYLQPRPGQLAIETDVMWRLVGEGEGLRRMQANAEVLIALAGLAQQWNFHESVVVAERMRRDGLALQRAVQELVFGMMHGQGRATGPFCVQEAASAYYLMRERILALYQTSHAGRYPRLAAALG